MVSPTCVLQANEGLDSAGGPRTRVESLPPTNEVAILLVSHDRDIDSFALVLRGLRLTVVCARTGSEAFLVARRTLFTLILLDLELPDMPGLELIRALHAERLETPFIAVSGHASISAVVDAMRTGALNVLQKPTTSTELCTAVLRAIAPATSNSSLRRQSTHVQPVVARDAEPRHPPSPARSRTVAERWALFVLHVVRSAHDLKTIDAWAKSVGASRSMICECCRLVHVVPHDARDFARMLRAVSSGGGEWRPEAVLDFADSRTLNKLVARAGLACWRETRMPTPEEFLASQRWIPPDNPGLLVLRALLF